MTTLIAAVVLLALLCLANLVLTYGVIRRLREHTALLSQSAGGPPPDLILGPGSTVGPFTATTVDGAVVDGDDLAAGTLVSFFSPGCGACATQLPEFVQLAGNHPGGQDGVLAVVVGEEAESAEQLAALAPVARVVLAQPGHEIETAFRVQGFPSFAVIGDERTIRLSGGLRAVAPAATVV
jgi:thiol-disulfide isomerase/thioredoxin